MVPHGARQTGNAHILWWQDRFTPPCLGPVRSFELSDEDARGMGYLKKAAAPSLDEPRLQEEHLEFSWDTGWTWSNQLIHLIHSPSHTAA